MQTMRRAMLGLSVLLPLSAPGVLPAGMVTITDTNLVAAGQHGGLVGSASFTGTNIPTDTTIAGGRTDSYSVTDIDFFEQSGQTIFNFQMRHNRSGLAISGAQTSLNHVLFTATADTTYALSGDYRLLGFGFNESGQAAGSINFSASLFDITTGNPATFVTLFDNGQKSDGTVNEQFVLGGQSGDTNNKLVGSLTGNLVAGHRYHLFFNATIGTFVDGRHVADDGASAIGQLRLEIGEPTAVPEPSSLALFGMAGLMLCGFWHRRRRVGIA